MKSLSMRQRFSGRRFAPVLKSGYRSKFEEDLANGLKARGVEVRYEPFKLSYKKPVKKDPTYTPDFVLPNGIIVEAKGYFESSDRTKHLLVKAQHPELDIRFVFQNSRNKISKNSLTSYADWCIKNGFEYADMNIPKEWINEIPKPQK